MNVCWNFAAPVQPNFPQSRPHHPLHQLAGAKGEDAVSEDDEPAEKDADAGAKVDK